LTKNSPDRGAVTELSADGSASRSDPVSVIADAADGADGIFGAPAYPDDPAAGMTFTAERDVDTQHPEERLRASQAATERAGIFGPPAPVR
jgi:hypothetical protein